MKVAVIGGTGVYRHSLIENSPEMTVETRFGTALVQKGTFKDREVFFLARHGPKHAVPPHRVNYRANIAALKKLGVEAVIATTAVGSLRRAIPPGSMVVIHQFIDFTKGRPATFFEGEGVEVVHADFTTPYCPAVRAALLCAGRRMGRELIDGGCYVCTEGPRFETPAEIKMMAGWGGDVVGMTNVPEAVLAREAGLCYAVVSLATNYAAGISESPLTHEEVLEEMARGKEALEQLIMAAVEEIPPARDCRCSEAAGGYWPFS